MAYIDPNDMYTFASDYENLLAKRREEARQMMLDELHRKQVEAGMENQKEQIATSRLYREAQAENLKSIQGGRFASQFGEGEHVGPMDIAKADSLGVGHMFDRGRTPDQITGGDLTIGPNGELGSSGQGVTMPSFKGTPQQQQETKDREILEQLAKDPSFHEADDMSRILMARSKGYKGTFPSELFKKPKEEVFGSIYGLNRDTGELEVWEDEEGNPLQNKGGDRVLPWAKPQQGGGGSGGGHNRALVERGGETYLIDLRPDENGGYRKPTKVDFGDTPPAPPVQGPVVNGQVVPPEDFNRFYQGVASEKPQPQPVFRVGTRPRNQSQSTAFITDKDKAAMRMAWQSVGNAGAKGTAAKEAAKKQLETAQYSLISKLPEDWMRADIMNIIRNEPDADPSNIDWLDTNQQPVSPEIADQMTEVLRYVLGKF